MSFRGRLYDNTMLSDFKRCPRLFYFRHKRGWVPVGTKAALAFGKAWHDAMDQIWVGRSVDDAYEAFLKSWVEQGLPADPGPAELEDLKARIPGTALEMLFSYMESRGDWIDSLELLAVERPFLVPVDPEDDQLWYAGRWDKVVRDRKQIKGIEHKTTTAYSEASGITQTYTESFSPNSQVDGYLYAGPLVFGENFTSVQVDAALVHKTIHDQFRIIPVERAEDHMDAWLWEARFWIRMIEANIEAGVDEEASYMSAWPKNTNSCFDFKAACPYLYICKGSANPASLPMPQGFKEEFWSPFDHLQLEKLGVEK